MTYLLDVNALVALGFLQHEFHFRVAAWLRSHTGKESPTLATCSITELGFVRVLAQALQYGFTVSQARDLLVRLKQERAFQFIFIADDQDISTLPSWVKTSRHVTDGHLAHLARANGSILATLDQKIQGSFLIPGLKIGNP
jgi:predicted nucleic acid-binding protein